MTAREDQPQLGTCLDCNHPTHEYICSKRTREGVFCFCGVKTKLPAPEDQPRPTPPTVIREGTHIHYMQRLPGGLCFAHGPYTEGMNCPQWPKCIVDPQKPEYLAMSTTRVEAQGEAPQVCTCSEKDAAVCRSMPQHQPEYCRIKGEAPQVGFVSDVISDGPSCTLCGAAMAATGYKCLSCGNQTGLTGGAHPSQDARTLLRELRNAAAFNKITTDLMNRVDDVLFPNSAGAAAPSPDPPHDENCGCNDCYSRQYLRESAERRAALGDPGREGE